MEFQAPAPPSDQIEVVQAYVVGGRLWEKEKGFRNLYECLLIDVRTEKVIWRKIINRTQSAKWLITV